MKIALRENCTANALPSNTNSVWRTSVSSLSRDSVRHVRMHTDDDFVRWMDGRTRHAIRPNRLGRFGVKTRFGLKSKIPYLHRAFFPVSGCVKIKIHQDVRELWSQMYRHVFMVYSLYSPNKLQRSALQPSAASAGPMAKIAGLD